MAQLSDDCFAQGGKLMRTDEALELLGRSVIRVTESEFVSLVEREPGRLEEQVAGLERRQVKVRVFV